MGFRVLKFRVVGFRVLLGVVGFRVNRLRMENFRKLGACLSVAP